jgi:hypothetical protein
MKQQNNGRITLALLGQKLDTVSDTVIRIDNTINGLDDQPGLKGRVKTLEDESSNRRWHFRTIWAAIAASGVGFYIKG